MTSIAQKLSPAPSHTQETAGAGTEGYSIQEVFDELDKEMITYYGEYGRELVNEEREEWNLKYPWHFDKL